ncbi:hypothetical protein INR49_003886 [Caranx melampygus]|nr:hypothetical protein INR49_003886 [Caranx melampygus]
MRKLQRKHSSLTSLVLAPMMGKMLFMHVLVVPEEPENHILDLDQVLMSVVTSGHNKTGICPPPSNSPPRVGALAIG